MKVESCPRCFSSAIKRNGRKKGIQQYKCLKCFRYFNCKTLTIFAHLQKLYKWNDFLEDFLSLNISTLRNLKGKLQLSEQTIFNWRHKLLSAIIVRSQNKFFGESLEFDETFFKISRKGRQNLGIKNKNAYRRWRKSLKEDSRHSVKLFFLYGRGSKKLDTYLSHMGGTNLQHLRNYFYKERFKKVIMISDSHPSYLRFFKKNKIPHEVCLSKDHIDHKNRKVHPKTVNAFTRGFKTFVNQHLRGVSTKYLSCYSKWFEFVYTTKQMMINCKTLRFDATKEIVLHVVKDNLGLDIYRQSETSFQYFLKGNHNKDFGNCKNHYYQQKKAA